MQNNEMERQQFSLILPLESPILRYSLEQKDWDTSTLPSPLPQEDYKIYKSV